MIKKMLDYGEIKNETVDNIVELGEEVSLADIAVIGISLEMPLAKNSTKYWENLKKGVDCIQTIPENRKKDLNEYFEFLNIQQDKKYIDIGYLNHIDEFDCNFFHLSPKEAEYMDPNQRLFLENAYLALEDAGYGGKKMKDTNTGVFVGFINQTRGLNYYQMVNSIDPSSLSLSLSGNLPAIIASRLSYFLDLKGPAFLVDTACSSSLVAVHLACQSIRNRECDQAIAGSVRVCFIPTETNIGIESSTGRTRAFDDSADGTGFGEGIAAVVLKPLDKAVKDGDNIYAVIKGSATNQDGRTIGITAPNSRAQEEVIVKAWEASGIDPESISYIEAHGTGTYLGDPIEIEGIDRAFKRFTDKKQFCAIGSVKTNIGHLDQAAGIAGLIKAILSLKYKQIPPSLHYKSPNREIDFVNSPVYVNNALSDWKVNNFPRRCGVSSFGFSGTNCHVILEEYVEKAERQKNEQDIPQILTLSAYSTDALLKILIDYKNWLNSYSYINPGDLCFTANTGRGHYNHRLAIIFKSLDDLEKKINYLIDSNISSEHKKGIFHSIVQSVSEAGKIDEDINSAQKHNCEMIYKDESKIRELCLAKPKTIELMEEICKLYTRGVDIDWDLFYHGSHRKRISLPLYPFDRRRCWVTIPKANQSKETEVLGREHNNYSTTEKHIAKIWGEVLGFDKINVLTNFFELGGDSIFAAKILNRINTEMSINVSVADILKYNTVEQISKFLDESNLSLSAKEQITKDIKQMVVVEKQEYYPLSSAQERMVVLYRLNSKGINYNCPSAFAIEGNVDKKLLESAIKKVIDRHEVFRTSFHYVQGQPVQKIHEKVDFKLEFTSCMEEQVDIEVQKFVKPFKLNQAPLFRAILINSGYNKNILLLDIHHIITDGTSLSIWIKELFEYYQGLELAPLYFQYTDFAVWQKAVLSTEFIKIKEEYWLKTLAGVNPKLPLPTDYIRPLIQSFEGSRVTINTGIVLSEKVKNLASQKDTTLYMVLLSAFYVLLSKYAGAEDIVVGCPITGRTRPEMENIVGLFVNTIPMRNYPVANKSFSEFLEEVKSNSLEAYGNQEYPFDLLVDRMNLQKDTSRNPLFDVMFVLQNMKFEKFNLKEEFNIKEVKINNYKLDLNKSMFDLTLEAIEIGYDIKLNFEFCTKLFKKESIEKMTNRYIDILEEIVLNPDIKLEEICIKSNLTELENPNKIEILFNF